MSADSLEAAYAPFVASLLAGGFSLPADGEWTAEQIAAHITLNNDLIAEAAEKVAAGREVSYDNEAGVDDAELTAYASAVGGLAGLASDIERSAARLAAARDALGDRADTLIPVLIRDGGEIAVDQQMPIGAFCEGNASFHLDMHLRQLKALGPDWRAGPPAEFDHYQLVAARARGGRSGAGRGGGRGHPAPAPGSLRQAAGRRPPAGVGAHPRPGYRRDQHLPGRDARPRPQARGG